MVVLYVVKLKNNLNIFNLFFEESIYTTFVYNTYYIKES